MGSIQLGWLPLAALGVLAWGQTPSPTSISGRILSTAGAPLKGASVRLQPSAQPRLGEPAATTYAVETGDKGEFRIENVLPGRYRLNAELTGYVRGFYLAPITNSPEITITANDPAQTIELRLAPEAIISGRVTNSDGKPFSGATVNLYRWNYTPPGRRQLLGAGRTQAGADGAFLIRGLSAGAYYVTAQDPNPLFSARDEAAYNAIIQRGRQARADSAPEEQNVVTYYPNGIDESAAVPIRLEAGASFPAADIQIQKVRVFGISGRVVDSVTGKPVAEADVNEYPADAQMDLRDLGRQVRTGADGAFSIGRLAPGEHILNVFARQVVSPNLKSVIVVNKDVDDLTLEVHPGFDVAGQVSFSEAGPVLPARPMVTLRRVSLAPIGSPAGPVSQDGNFSVTGVTPGLYEVALSPIPDGAYIQSVRLDNQDVTGRQVTVSPGARLEIVLSPRAAQVGGTVRDREGKAMPGATVTLWKPGFPPPALYDATRVTQTGADGRFAFSGVPPGEYRLAAWDQIENGLAQYPPFRIQFDSSSTQVKLAEGARENADLIAISRDAIQSAEARQP